MANQYDVGRIIRVAGLFTTNTGAAFDPTTVLTTVKLPSGVLTTYQYGSDLEVVKDSTGQYHIDIETTLPGTWYYRWFSQGTWKTSTQAFFTVRKVLAS